MSKIKKKFEPPKKTFCEILDTWKKTKALGFREKIKAHRSISFDIKAYYKNNECTKDELAFFIKVLANTKLANRLQSKMLTEWYNRMGYGEARISFKKNAKICIEGGAIAIFDKKTLKVW